ncbi:MAG TPA: helix-turn-helix transcriptional regulator [Pseudonocardiaceae bacterium]
MATLPVGGRSQAVQLGAELREQRKRAGMTVVQVGEALGFHHSTISRWERGESMPDEADTAAALAVYGVRGADRDRLVELVRLNSVADWVAPHGGQQLAALMEYERRAQRITEVHPLLVPGLLQTRDYARSLMIGNGVSPNDAERLADVRTGRQRVLAGRTPAALVAIIGEQAIRYPVCDIRIMIEQLNHLLAMGRRPNVEVLVLPLDLGRFTPAFVGQFILLEPLRDNPVVQVESCGSMSMLTNERTVRRYQNAVDKIRADALDARSSAQRIADLATELETRV